MKKYQVLCGFMMFLLSPGIGVTAQLCPCTIIAFANANTYIQAPSYSQKIPFDSPLRFTDCTTTTAATIIVANPPQNPPVVGPVYMNLYGTTDSIPDLLLMQGTTVITKSDFPTWFSATATYTGINLKCSKPWVPSSITIMYF